MVPILTVTEYQPIKIGNVFSSEEKVITQIQADYIEKWEKEHKNSIFRWGNRKISPQQWVGIMGTPVLQIEILPKIQNSDKQMIRENLLYMLSVANNVSYRVNKSENIQSRKNTFLEGYITVFIDMMNRAIKKGIIHQYRQIESNEKFLKGKLVLSPHIRKNLLNRTNFYIRYDEFTINNLVNRIFKATIIKLMNLTQNYKNVLGLNNLKNYFIGVDEKKFSLDDFSKVTLNRVNKHFDQLLEMCKVFWKDQIPDFRSGEIKTFNLLFDMNMIYERFIQYLLWKYQDEIFDNKDYYIVREKKSRYLLRNHLNNGVFKLIPDNIIWQRGSNKAVKIIDTKWKILDQSKPNLGISQDDIYQMYAYAREFECEEVILLYPGIMDNYEQLPIYYNDRFINNKIKITRRTINLNVNLPNELPLVIKELKSFFNFNSK